MSFQATSGQRGTGHPPSALDLFLWPTIRRGTADGQVPFGATRGCPKALSWMEDGRMVGSLFKNGRGGKDDATTQNVHIIAGIDVNVYIYIYL